MKKVLTILVMMVSVMNTYAEGWKNGSIVPDLDYQSTKHITYYERTSGYVGLIKDSEGRYCQIVLKTNVGLYDFDYKTKVVLYDANNVETECFQLDFDEEYLFNKSFMNSEYRFSRYIDEDVIEFIANGRGYVRFISQTTFDGKVEIKVPCMNNGKKTSVKRKTIKNTPVKKRKTEKEVVMDNNIKEKQEQVNQQVDTQDYSYTYKPAFGKKLRANNEAYRKHKQEAYAKYYNR